MVLAGCADSEILNDLTGEPPPGTMANRAGILRVDSRETTWPNLARVPPRPANLMPQAARDAQKTALEQQRVDGLTILQASQQNSQAADAPAIAAAPAAMPIAR